MTGKVQAIPIRDPDQVRHWRIFKGSSAPNMPWTGRMQDASGTLREACLYRTTWENPQPELEIRSIDFVRIKWAPFLLGITAEE